MEMNTSLARATNFPSIRVWGVGFALCGLGLAPALAFAQGKGAGVEARNIAPPLQEALPGTIVSLSLRIANTSGRAEELGETLTLPDGWQALLPASIFSLSPGESTTRLIAFQVPRGAPAGEYQITYAAIDRRDYALRDETSFTIKVLPSSKLALLIENKSDFAIAGDDYQVKIRLLNQGNAPLSLTLKAESDRTYPARIEPAEIALPANESSVAAVTVSTDPREKNLRKQVLKILALTSGAKGAEIAAGLTILMDIIPRSGEAVDLSFKMPANLTLRAAGGDDSSRPQWELRGGGPLEEYGSRTLDFLLRFPDAPGENLLGLREEYLLNYGEEAISLRLGDQGYGLTPLTEYYRYGRGFEVNSGKSEPLSWKSYHLLGRWDSAVEEWGAQVRRQFEQQGEISLNFLDKNTAAVDGVAEADDRMVSIAGAYRPNSLTEVQLEYGRDFRNPGEGDDAYRLELRGSGKDGSYQFTKIHAAPDYFGYYNDADYTSGALTFPLLARLRGQVSFRSWQRNLELRDALGSAPRENLAQFGLLYSMPGNYSLNLDYDCFRRQDALSPADFDYREQPLSLSLSRATSHCSVRGDIRLGRQQDLLLDRSEQVRQYSMYLYYRPSRRQSLSVYGTLGDDHALAGSYLLGSRDNLGATLTLSPSDNLDVRLSCLRYGFASSQEQEQKELLAGYRLAGGQTLSLRARATKSHSDGIETSYVMEYSLPFQLPLGKKRSIGALRGRVFDADAAAHPGLAKVILRVNNLTAVTDSKGQFTFPALPPGNYPLQIDNGSIGLNRVPLAKQPILVKVTPGEIASLDAAITEAARITGSITLARQPQPTTKAQGEVGEGADGTVFVLGNPQGKSALGEASGESSATAPLRPFSGILVELRNGDEVIRTLTDNDGQFIFDGLRPAQWQLKIYDFNLPAFHYLDTPEMSLSLAPGEDRNIPLRVLPQARPIRMIDTGRIVSTPTAQ
jgi:hypothetical protein